MQHHALIAAFRQLHTNDSRLNAIEALAQELTSHEWRTLRDIAAARSFHTDIVGQLPLELVAQIFAHLDTSTPFRLQSVSKKWRHLLQSPELLTTTLVSWYGYTPQLLRADYSLCKSKAQVIHAFRHGSPKRHFKIKTVRETGVINLAGDMLVSAVTSHNSTAWRALRLFNLKTWTLYSLTGDARERVHQTFSSEQIAGFTTESHVCYVSDLQGRGKRKFRVPSVALFQSVACRGHTVACAGCLKDHAEVYIWDYETQQGKSFSINFNSHLFPFPKTWRNHKHGIALLLQPEAKRITVFTDERCHGGNEFDEEEERCQRDKCQSTFRYAQFDYKGNCVFESKMVVPELDSFQHASFQNGYNQFTPVNDRGTFKISVLGGRYGPPIRWLQFDERVNDFTQPVPTTENGQMWAEQSLFWWKDTIYSSMKSSGHVKSTSPSYLNFMGTSDRPQNKPLLLHAHGAGDDVDSVRPRDSIFLNEKYLVRAISDGFHVFCFEDSAHYPQESGAFFDQGSVEVIDV